MGKIPEWSDAEQRAIVEAATTAVLLYGETEQCERVEGAVWYPERWVFCERLWPEHPERVAGMLAATSSRTTWQVNQAYVVRLMTAITSGAECPNVHTFDGRDKAWRIAHGEDIPTVLHGPKITDFYYSIIGVTDRPVIDRWMARAMGWNLRDNQGLQPRQYRLLSEALTLAARQLDVSPRYLQATLWIHKRGGSE